MPRCTGKTDIHNLEPEDLRAISVVTAQVTGSRSPGSTRGSRSPPETRAEERRPTAAGDTTDEFCRYRGLYR